MNRRIALRGPFWPLVGRFLRRPI